MEATDDFLSEGLRNCLSVLYFGLLDVWTLHDLDKQHLVLGALDSGVEGGEHFSNCGI